MTFSDDYSERLLLLAPTPKDATLSRSIITGSGIRCDVVSNLASLYQEVKKGCAVVMLPEESVEIDADDYLFVRFLESQPAWSDLPVIVMTKGGADSAIATRALTKLGNVVLLERPVRVNTLISTVRVALRARLRQYEIKNLLEQHEASESVLREKGELLMDQAERLFRSNKELEQFAYVTSHDLQEPLRKISTFAQLLSERYHSQLDDDGKRYLDILTTSANRMTSLIRDLLSYARLSGKELTAEPVGLNVPLASVLTDLDMLIQEKKAKIEIGPMPTVIANSTRLHHVFLNLINNAIKFQKQGNPVVRVSAKEVDGFAEIMISDNGIGIEPKYFQQIFQVFQRLHVRSKYEGNGIGLAICKKIIEQHKGRIWVESAPGAGATFHFTLPLASTPSPAPSSANAVPK
jgi:signal transduction histidine kinase